VFEREVVNFEVNDAEEVGIMEGEIGVGCVFG
jgi:hypothetical protein